MEGCASSEAAETGEAAGTFKLESKSPKRSRVARSRRSNLAATRDRDCHGSAVRLTGLGSQRHLG